MSRAREEEKGWSERVIVVMVDKNEIIQVFVQATA